MVGLPAESCTAKQSEKVATKNVLSVERSIIRQKGGFQMLKPSAGPWKITHTALNGYRVSDSTGWGVAVVLKDTNDEANARLIAAAPLMLELLKQIADWPFPFLSGAGIDEVRELAGKMVEKVEGEE
jgi:hypothetical protein